MCIVILYTYNQRKSDVWWSLNSDKLSRFKNLNVVYIDAKGVEPLLQRNIDLQCNVQEGEMTLSTLQGESTVNFQLLKSSD